MLLGIFCRGGGGQEYDRGGRNIVASYMEYSCRGQEYYCNILARGQEFRGGARILRYTGLTLLPQRYNRFSKYANKIRRLSFLLYTKSQKYGILFWKNSTINMTIYLFFKQKDYVRNVSWLYFLTFSDQLIII